MWITPEELAKELGVANRQLQRWRQSKRGPKFSYLTAKTVRYRREDIDAWLKTRPTAPVGRLQAANSASAGGQLT